MDQPCPEGVRKDSGWKDKEDSGVRNGRRTTRFQKRERYGGRDVHSETTGWKETGVTGEYGFGIHRH